MSLPVGVYFLKTPDIYNKNKKTMKKIIRLTESDLTRIVRRVILEEEQAQDEQALIDEIDGMMDNLPDGDDPKDPGLMEKIIDRIQEAGHDVQTILKKLRRNNKKALQKFNKNANRYMDRVKRNVTRFRKKLFNNKVKPKNPGSLRGDFMK